MRVDDDQSDEWRISQGSTQTPRGADADGLLRIIGSLERAAAGAALLIALAGCGSRGDNSGNGLTDAQIEALSLGKAKNKGSTGRPEMSGLEPLTPADVSDPALRGGCALVVANESYLVAGPWNAVARRNGRLLTLQVNGPVSQAGAFFETEAMSISIGQPRGVQGSAPPPPGTARARINDRRMGNSLEVEATWRCGG